MWRRTVTVITVVMAAVVWASPSLAQADTSFCSDVFSGDQGLVFKEDGPPRYAQPVQDNGDGTYTLSYGIVSRRYMGSNRTADVYDCAFVDANGNSRHDANEQLVAVSARNVQFQYASSSSTVYILTVTIAARPGDRVCDRAQVESFYNGTFVDKSQYFCETLPGGVEVPVGPLGALGGGVLLGGGLWVRQVGSRRMRGRSST